MTDKLTGYLMASTFRELRALNEQRARRWHGPDSVPWTGADWSNAMCGEAGEVANAVKKIRRIETRVNSNNPMQPIDYAHARDMIAKEIGDTLIYLDLLAAHYAIDLGQAILHAFNTVSAREGFPESLALVSDTVTEHKSPPAANPDALELQSREFNALETLITAYKRLPAIVDDDYPEMRHGYEAALRDFIAAVRANGRV